MVPFRVTAASQQANASPSITLERGSYRMRAPNTRTPAFISRDTKKTRIPDRRNSNIVFFLLILVFSCVSCFGTAYYLFATRWEHRSISQPSNFTADSTLQAHEHSASKIFPSDSQMRYLAYLPHSGFHNQRIAFENALVLARLLNRTLLVPPVRLGNKPIRYVNFDNLQRFLALSSKEGLIHCANVFKHTSLPSECLDYFEYTHVAWNWLFNLTMIEHQQSLVYRPDLSHDLGDYLKIPTEQILTLRDESPYHYRFLDTMTSSSSQVDKYLTHIYISSLMSSTVRLIQVGTLFGSSRLRLRSNTSLSIRTVIRQNMIFTHTTMVEIANSIEIRLGVPYVSAHIRLNDGKFRINSEINARLVWWKIVHRVLGFSLEDTARIEKMFGVAGMTEHNLEPPRLPVDHKQEPSIIPYPMFPKYPRRPRNCRGKLHSENNLARLNIPLFICTDTEDPLNHSLISRFRDAFPCTFFLSDFPTELQPLVKLNNHDGVKLQSFLLPFIDALIAGRAWRVVGTDGSTFSQYIEDVLWTTHHGYPIVQRG